MNIQHIHGVPPLYTNTFLIITNAKHGILIDAAAEPATYQKALDEAGATLSHILLTHGHTTTMWGRWQPSKKQPAARSIWTLPMRRAASCCP